jgi:hypothetical protein
LKGTIDREEHIDDDLEDVIARTLAQTDDCIVVE